MSLFCPDAFSVVPAFEQRCYSYEDFVVDARHRSGQNSDILLVEQVVDVQAYVQDGMLQTESLPEADVIHQIRDYRACDRY